MTAHDEAVKAAAEALTRTPCVREFGEARYGGATPDEAGLMAEAAVAAAAPILAAAERQRIAAAIKNLDPPAGCPPMYWTGFDAGTRAAARIAEGTAQ